MQITPSQIATTSHPDSLHPCTLAGRCTSGDEHGQGTRVHAVQGTINAFHEVSGHALCGAEPGRRSVGWSHRSGSCVTCPRCLARMAKLTTQANGAEADAEAEAERCISAWHAFIHGLVSVPPPPAQGRYTGPSATFFDSMAGELIGHSFRRKAALDEALIDQVFPVLDDSTKGNILATARQLLARGTELAARRDGELRSARAGQFVAPVDADGTVLPTRVRQRA